ncbi:MAG TPA: Ada metal-binding domain-containing protein [Pontiellaceae bacterium]|nr:Ada metal-binding domain-containing protein [Pontiellaceae bacterium]HPR83784.1 Ada metal-binding domain-containing protein [Pontiellaceae bacterium]
MKKLAIIAAVMLSTALVSTAADPAVTYKGNPDSKIFHLSSCHHATNANCTATFTTHDAAAGAGYTPCKVCKP